MADLLMECEEEELEPWQRIGDEDEEEEEVSLVGNRTSGAPPVGSPVELPAPVSTPVVAHNTPSSGDVQKNTVTLLTSGALPQMAPLSSAPLVPQPAPGRQLILTQGPVGLGTVATSQGLQPMVSAPVHPSAAVGVVGQPVFISTQGFSVQNVNPAQSSVKPLGFVLNGQPFTLVHAPDSRFYKPAVGVSPVPSLWPVAKAGGGSLASTFTALKIPATLPVHSAAPQAAGTQLVWSSGQPHTAQTSMAFSASGQARAPEATKQDLPRTVLGWPPCVRSTSKAPANGLPAAPLPLLSVKGGARKTGRMCPQCGAQFRVVESLRGYMCHCSPELAKSLQTLEESRPADQRSTQAETMSHVPTRAGVAPPLRSQEAPPPRSEEASVAPPPRSEEASVAPPPGSEKASVAPPPRSEEAPPPRSEEASVTLSPLSEEEGPSSSGVSEGKLVMLVDEFYYGSDPGNSAAASWMTTKSLFKCLSCSKKLKNNIRLMDHMKRHQELEKQSGEVETYTSCQHCFRQFSTPFRLQCHVEAVHGQFDSTTKCKICEWEYGSELVFLQHMKSCHKPGEMPYVCLVCEFRSSFYSDVYGHFRSCHSDTSYLLCPYCLKVFWSKIGYQQHCHRHQKKKVYPCDKCRLQFLFIKEKEEHKLLQHKTFRRPRKLEGLVPGTKVTIRAYTVQAKFPRYARSPESEPPNETPSKVGEFHSSHSYSFSDEAVKITPKMKAFCSMQEMLTKLQEDRAMLGKQSCLECNFEIPDFSNHYPTYVHCSLCNYSTCCSRAYANHMIGSHLSRKTTSKYLALYKECTRWTKLVCVTCDMVTQVGDIMANHLVKHPSHCCSVRALGDSSTNENTQDSQRFTQKAASVTSGSQRYLAGKTSEGVGPKEMASNPMEFVPFPLQPQGLPRSPQQTTTAPTQTVLRSTHTLPQRQEMDPDTGAGARDGAEKGYSEEAEVLSAVAAERPVSATAAVGKERPEMLTPRRLRILLFALCCGVPQAAQHFGTQQELIWALLREKEHQRSQQGPREDEGGAVDRLVEWVLTQREQQLPVNEKNLFQKASEMHKKANQGSFSISYEWTVDFLLQHELGLQATGTVGRSLFRKAEENARAFTRFVHKHRQGKNTPLSVLGAMDELSVFVDFSMLLDPASVGHEAAFQLVGTDESAFDIVLAALADGTMLPTMVFFRGRPPEKLGDTLPDTILLVAQVEGFTKEEELRLWNSHVWQKHMEAHRGAKGMLMVDSFRGHQLDDFVVALSQASTQPAVIPVGCTCRLQPLEMCVGPVLRGFLLARWSQLVRQGGAAGAKPKDVAQLLVAWLTEALACLRGRPDLLRRSFQVAGALPEEGNRDKADVQREMVHTLTEALMGPTALKPATLGEEKRSIEEEEEEEEDPSSPCHFQLTTISPKALRQELEKESDAESFLGFDDF